MGKSPGMGLVCTLSWRGSRGRGDCGVHDAEEVVVCAGVRAGGVEQVLAGLNAERGNGKLDECGVKKGASFGGVDVLARDVHRVKRIAELVELGEEQGSGGAELPVLAVRGGHVGADGQLFCGQGSGPPVAGRSADAISHRCESVAETAFQSVRCP